MEHQRIPCYMTKTMSYYGTFLLLLLLLNMYHGYSILGSTIEYNVNTNVLHLLKVPCFYFIYFLHIPCYYPGFLGSTV